MSENKASNSVLSIGLVALGMAAGVLTLAWFRRKGGAQISVSSVLQSCENAVQKLEDILQSDSQHATA